MRHEIDDDLNFIDVEEEKTIPVAKIIFVMIGLAAAILAGAYYLQNNHNGNQVQNIVQTAEALNKDQSEGEAQNLEGGSIENADSAETDAFEYAADQADKQVEGHSITILPDTLYSSAKEAADNLISGSNLVSSDLDFWNMYNKQQEPSKDKPEVIEEEKKEEEKTDPSTDGKHTKLVAEDGTEEWIEIDEKLRKNTY